MQAVSAVGGEEVLGDLVAGECVQASREQVAEGCALLVCGCRGV